ncbi:MAG: glycosyltransferase family 4 protein, partial [Bacteroidales bacterium]|nr:glycosyltransferase family 4 protein [Bacteroidales bacterium]
MKTNIYLFTNQDQSSEYGRGTYFRQMIECFNKNETISLHIVQLFTDESEFKIIQQENVEIITFPIRYVPFQSIERYYRNSWYILKKYIRTQEEEQLIFHLNFVYQYQLVKYMRKDFPGCKVFFTLHFQQWTSTLSGDDISYKKIIRESSSLSLSPIEQEIYNHFLFEKRVLEGVDKTICLSRFTENLLKEIYGLPKEYIQFIPKCLAN